MARAFVHPVRCITAFAVLIYHHKVTLESAMLKDWTVSVTFRSKLARDAKPHLYTLSNHNYVSLL